MQSGSSILVVPVLVQEEENLHTGPSLALLCPAWPRHQTRGCPEPMPLIASPNYTLRVPHLLMGPGKPTHSGGQGQEASH